MKKLLNAYRKAATWLASFGADRYLHLLAGLILAFIIGVFLCTPLWVSGLLALAIVIAVGWLKEIFDSFTGELGDLVDWLFTSIGGAIGYGLLMLSTLV